MKTLRIGIDFGGVLSIHDRGNQNGNEHRSTVVNMPDALDVLRVLKTTKLDGIDKVELYVISFAGKSRSRETKESLLNTCPDIFDGYYFTKSKENKKYVCEYLGVDVMIDDTVEVLENVRKHSLGKHMPKLYLFTGDPSYEDKREEYQSIEKVAGWKEMLKVLMQNNCSNESPGTVWDTHGDKLIRLDLKSIQKYIYDV